jgi:hypothetical protein
MLCAFQHIRADVGVSTIQDPLRGDRTTSDKNGGLVDELQDATVHYSQGASQAQGNSLGEWAPTPITETVAGVAAPWGNRPGITTVTVELPQGEADDTIQRLVRIHAEVTLSVFPGATQARSPATHIAPVATQAGGATSPRNRPDVMKGCERRS